jgi:uncharacterized protein involved in tolerance to divalent cations
MSQYFKVEISAETKAQADDILNALLAKRLVTGGQIVAAPARFLWKGKIVNMDYYTVMSFTLAQHREAITATVKPVSIEEVPMITFLAMDGNPELLDWIRQTVSDA